MSSRPPVPRARLRHANDAPIHPERAYVLYLMTATRRLRDNYALDHALALGRELGKPVVVLEALRAGYPHASRRMHRFVLDGMVDQHAAAAGSAVRYLAYVEPRPGAGKTLFVDAAAHACVVVTDDSPAFFLPRMVAATARAIAVRLDAVDSVGLVPLALEARRYGTAYAFRRELQKLLPPQLDAPPCPEPLPRGKAPRLPALEALLAQHPFASVASLRDGSVLDGLAFDRDVREVATRGGAVEAERALARFVEHGLPRYDERHHPDAEVASGLSPYLHFGHLSVHRVFAAVTAGHALRLTPNGGKREGYYGLSPAVEGFLDQLVTHRELCQRHAREEPLHASYAGVPAWARKTLDVHRRDARPYVYDLETLEQARTHDPIWNAAQRELVHTGAMHNYLRMLWGKLILGWSRTPEEAFTTCVLLNDRYALDGRDPNTLGGVGWVFGLFDRPFGPERPVIGALRPMTSASTARKLRLTEYLRRFGEPERTQATFDF